MRYGVVFFIFFTLLSGGIHAQEKFDDLETTALGRREINRNDTVYTFYVLKPLKPLKTSDSKLYYWYRKDTIMTTTGDYDGWVLDGSYKVLYPDKNLRESGSFQNGLKVGEWKTWYIGGNLHTVSYWKKGEQVGSVTRYSPDGKIDNNKNENKGTAVKKRKKNQQD